MATIEKDWNDPMSGIGNVFGTIVILGAFALIILFAVGLVNGRDAVRTNSQLITEHCRPNSYFAQASDGNGTFYEFCKMDTGQIGIKKYINHRLVKAEILEGDFTFMDLINYIESNGARLLSYVSGLIPQQ